MQWVNRDVQIMSFSGLVLLLCAFTSIVSTIAAIVNRNVPEPYMDEIFHVPQTQKYCEGQWMSWDAKITTFPGLYLMGTAAGWAQRALGLVLPQLDSVQMCDTFLLRGVNAVLSITCLPIFYFLAAALDHRRTPLQLVLMTIVCALFPLHFFYSFLYYTDVGSTMFTMAVWLAACQKRFKLAGILGAAAVLIRQTNAVWVAFIAARAALDICLHDDGPRGEPSYSNKLNNDNALEVFIFYAKRGWAVRRVLIERLWPMAGVVGAFAVFVVWNGGIVVGDKAHHVPVRHWAQPLYCALYCTVCLGPAFWVPRQPSKKNRRNGTNGHLVVWNLIISVGTYLAVEHGTLVHPFLLADNRHYTFYVWRRIIGSRPWTRFALIPAYVYSIIALNSRLCASGRCHVERLLLAGAAMVVLIPSHLLELRYFSVVFYAVILLMRTPSVSQLALTATGFALVNALTLFVFVGRPFTWQDGSTARFMW